MLSIIIVNWNSKDFVRQCLTSLNRYCPGPDREVIVVDGASFDGCDVMLAREFPSARFVQSPANIGFARANNLGARHAAGTVFWFLNPDTELLEDSLTPMLQRLATLPQAGAVGCKLLNSDRSVQTSCVQSFPTAVNQALDSEFLHRCFPRSSLWGIAALHSNSGEPSAVEVISGACILMKREMFESVGGFSENYFMYAEDLDLCFKIRQSGRKVYYVPETGIVHHGGGSTKASTSNFSNVMMRESVHRFLRLRRGAASAALYRASMMMTSLVRLALIFPLVALARRRVVSHGRGSFQKWKSILRWSCGLEGWAAKLP